jgi:hypothetical protein
MKQKVLFYLFFCLGYLAFAGEKDKGVDNKKNNYTYSAQLIDAKNGEIISGANIILEDGTSISSDFDGVFKFIQTKSQTIKVKINAIGYQFKEFEIHPLTLTLPSISLESL